MPDAASYPRDRNDANSRVPSTTPLLEVTDASKTYGGGFLSGGRAVHALRACSLTIDAEPATITAIAGESGSGKSTLVGAVLGLLRLDEGFVRFAGRDVKDFGRRERLKYRRQVQAVFQDPYAVFNPFYRARHIFDMVIRRFGVARNGKEARDRIEAALGLVGLRGEDVLEKYPHQLSGGQRQRMMVARAYLLRPRLIVADEPVSMVDASLRSMILDVMLRLRDEEGISFLYITHDLSTAYQIADRIHILYRGHVVERGPVVRVVDTPSHPYTRTLIDSVPLPDPSQRWTEDITIEWEEEDDLACRNGCCFQGRCTERVDVCRESQPALLSQGPAHDVACHVRSRAS